MGLYAYGEYQCAQRTCLLKWVGDKNRKVSSEYIKKKWPEIEIVGEIQRKKIFIITYKKDNPQTCSIFPSRC